MSRRSSFSNDAALTTITAVVGRGLGLLGSLVTTHVFAAEQFGIWLLVLTFANFFLPLTTVRLEVPYVMAPTIRLRRGIWSLFGIFTALVLVCMLVFLLVSPSWVLNLATGLTSEQRRIALFSLPVLFFLTTNLVVQAELIRGKQFAAIAVMNVATPAVALVLILALPPIFGPTPEVAAIVFIVSSLVGLSCVYFGRDALKAIKVPRFRPVQTAIISLKRYSVYPKYSLPLSLSVTATERIIQLLMVQFYSLGSLASFYLARQILSGVTSVIANSLRVAFFAYGASDLRLEDTGQRALFTLKLLTYLVAPCLAFFVFWIRDFVSVFVGAGWVDLPLMAWYCMFPAFILVLTGPLDRAFDLAGKQKLSVALQVLSDLAKLIAVGLAVQFGAGLETMVAAATASLLIYNLIWLGFALRVLEVSWSDVRKVFLRILLTTIGCMFLHWMAQLHESRSVSFGFAVMLLMLTLTPGTLAMLSAVSFSQPYIPSKMRAVSQKLP
jgi:O-antigen/teichoic acid export membrane protein